MHGYEANLELERRCVGDWAGISRPQVYYSLDKLAAAGFVRAGANDEPAAGPERRVFETTAKGRHALSEALEREEWATQRDRPVFLTWVALSWQARPGVFATQIRRREEFLRKELARLEKEMESILEEVGHSYHEAVWMVSLMIEQLQDGIAMVAEGGGGVCRGGLRRRIRSMRVRRESLSVASFLVVSQMKGAARLVFRF